VRAAFGGAGLGSSQLTYEGFIGLWLNIDRARAQWAVAVAEGMGFAQGGDLDWSVFDAIALMPEQVDDLMYETNAARRTAETLAKFGTGDL
jgi:hypothetical protein